MRYRESLADKSSWENQKGPAVLDTDMKFTRSPLVRYIFSLVSTPQTVGKEESGVDEAKRVIANLYKCWNKRDLPQLNIMLIDILAPARYRETSSRDLRKRAADQARESCMFWMTVDGYLKSYIRFLEEYGERLVGLGELSEEVRHAKPANVAIHESQLVADDSESDSDEDSPPKVEQPLDNKGGGVTPAPKKSKPASTTATPTKRKPLKKGDEDENGDTEKGAEKKQVQSEDEEDEAHEEEEEEEVDEEEEEEPTVPVSRKVKVGK